MDKLIITKLSKAEPTSSPDQEVRKRPQVNKKKRRVIVVVGAIYVFNTRTDFEIGRGNGIVCSNLTRAKPL